MTDAIFEDVNIKILWVDLSEQDRENYRMYSVECTLYFIKVLCTNILMLFIVAHIFHGADFLAIRETKIMF